MNIWVLGKGLHKKETFFGFLSERCEEGIWSHSIHIGSPCLCWTSLGHPWSQQRDYSVRSTQKLVSDAAKWLTSFVWICLSIHAALVPFLTFSDLSTVSSFVSKQTQFIEEENMILRMDWSNFFLELGFCVLKAIDSIERIVASSVVCA